MIIGKGIIFSLLVSFKNMMHRFPQKGRKHVQKGRKHVHFLPICELRLFTVDGCCMHLPLALLAKALKL